MATIFVYQEETTALYELANHLVYYYLDYYNDVTFLRWLSKPLVKGVLVSFITKLFVRKWVSKTPKP